MIGCLALVIGTAPRGEGQEGEHPGLGCGVNGLRPQAADHSEGFLSVVYGRRILAESFPAKLAFPGSLGLL